MENINKMKLLVKLTCKMVINIVEYIIAENLFLQYFLFKLSKIYKGDKQL